MHRNKIFSLFAILAAFLSVPVILEAQTAPEAKTNTPKPYVINVSLLEQACREQSGKFVREEYGKAFEVLDHQFIWNSYQNHYNKKMNRCFVLTVRKIEAYKDGAAITYTRLTDMNDKAAYGYLIVDRDRFVCYVSGKVCTSMVEWEKLITPYMKE